MSFSSNWNVDKYKNDYESDDHWSLRREFMLAHKDKFPEPQLVCLTQVFFNMEFLGCRYPEKTMNLVNKLAAEVARDFREGRKGKLKRTFVGAQDAAGAKAKRAKPPTGTVEGSETKKEDDVDAQSSWSAIKRERDADEDTNKESSNSGNSHDSKKFKPEVKEKKSEFEDVLREAAKTVVFMIPLRQNSRTEADCVSIMHYNFPSNQMSFRHEGSKAIGGWTCTTSINLVPSSDRPKAVVASVFAPTQREGKQESAAMAVKNLSEYCTLIEPKNEYFLGGKTPEFIEKRIPCSKTPRSYLIMTKKETGHITAEVADLLIQNFKKSSNEDMFFPDKEYTEKEKVHLLNRSQTHKVGFRHFGENRKMSDHHICIYKPKTPAEILEEARKLNWNHPKYKITLRN